MNSRSQNHRLFVREVLLLNLIYVLADTEQINFILNLCLAKGSDVEIIFHFFFLFQRFQIFLEVLISIRIAISEIDQIIGVLKLVGERQGVKVDGLKVLRF